MHTTPVTNVFTESADVGPVGLPGMLLYDAQEQTYLMRAAGKNIWGTEDSFYYAWVPLQGDCILSARATWPTTGQHPHRKLGWMLRTSLAPDAAHVSAVLHGDGLLSLQFRRTHGAETEELRMDARGADLIQLERIGTTFRMLVAHHGELPTMITLEWDGLPEQVLAGLFVCSHDANLVEEALFDNVRIVVPAPESAHHQGQLGSLLEIVDLATGRRRVLLRSPQTFEAPNWTPDGSALIYNSGGLLYRYDLASGMSIPINTGSVQRNNNDHVLSFDGRMLGISSADADGASIIYTVPVTGGEPARVTPTGPSYLHGWSPDGQFLVYTGLRNGDYDIYRIPAIGGTEEQLTNVPGLDDGPEYSPDGAYIYFNSVRSGSMQIWRMLPDGSQQEQVTDDAYNNWFAHITPDGSAFVYLSYAEPINPSAHPPAKRVYLRIMPATGGPSWVLAYLYGGQGTINVPSWAPDGSQLAFVSNTA